MKTAQQIIESKPVKFNTVALNDTVLTAISLMRSENLSYVTVLDDGKFVGLLGEKDYTQNGILEGRHSDTTLVKEMMHVQYPTVQANDTSDVCLEMMDIYKTRYLVVFDQHTFIGVLTMHDLLREKVKEGHQ
ncbi:MAG: cyclic nucleotide-binding/CBS domain-containing protein [Chitinophagaceae bacterium]